MVFLKRMPVGLHSPYFGSYHSLSLRLARENAGGITFHNYVPVSPFLVSLSMPGLYLLGSPGFTA
jgi:hypothetical protein